VYKKAAEEERLNLINRRLKVLQFLWLSRIWILRDFGGALKFLSWLISGTRRAGFFPILGDLISRIAFLRKNDAVLYQNWIQNVEHLPSTQFIVKNTYDLVVIVDSTEGETFKLFLEHIRQLSWIDRVTILLPESPSSECNIENVTFSDYASFKLEHLNHTHPGREQLNNIVFIHTLALFESAWIPEIDSLLMKGADLVIVDQDSVGDSVGESTTRIKDNVAKNRKSPYFKSGFSLELAYDPAYAPCIFLTNHLFCDVLSKTQECEQVAYGLSSALMSEASSPKHLAKVAVHLLEKPTPWNAISKPFKKESRTLDLSTSGSHFPEVYEPINSLSVTIIIPIKDNINLLIECIETISQHQYQSKYEILVLDNGSEEPETQSWLANAEATGLIRCIQCDFEFNWSKLSNIGIENSEAEIIVLLNNDTLVITGDWLDRLAALTMEDKIGVVGPLLLYPDDAIQHAGVVVGFGGFADHIYMNEPAANRESEITVSPHVRRDVSACTGACQVFTRKTYLEVGPFNEALRVTGDIEFCLRAQKMGMRNLYEPAVSLYHLESKTRRKGLDDEERWVLKEAIGELTVLDDPYFNPNLSRSSRSPMPNLIAVR